MDIQLHYTRLHGKPLTIYKEVLLAEDAVRLKSESIIPIQNRQAFSELWWRPGLIPQGREIARLVKHYFYKEWFDVLQVQAADGTILGYYSDICTPLTKTSEGQYALTDLMLDLWLGADGAVKELDWDEFEEVVQHNHISAGYATQAKQTLARLVAETAQGIYPSKYIA